MIELKELWWTQNKLKRIDIIPKLILVRNFKTKIALRRTEDGTIEIKDGHHRVTALWCKGVKIIHSEEYSLIDTDEFRLRFGQTEEMFARLYMRMVP